MPSLQTKSGERILNWSLYKVYNFCADWIDSHCLPILVEETTPAATTPKPTTTKAKPPVTKAKPPAPTPKSAVTKPKPAVRTAPFAVTTRVGRFRIIFANFEIQQSPKKYFFCHNWPGVLPFT